MYTPTPHHDPMASASSGHAWLHVFRPQVSTAPPHGRIIPIGQLFEQLPTLCRIMWRLARLPEYNPTIAGCAAYCVNSYEREQ